MCILIPSVVWFKFADELLMALLLGLATLDCIVNGNLRRYALLWIIVAIMIFYAGYSIVFMNFNTTKSILMDMVIELKPFLPFAVIIAIRPTLTERDKSILRIIAITNTIIAFGSVFLGYYTMIAILGHYAMIGITIFVCSLVYYYCSLDKEGISRRNLLILILMLISGLVCTRSKYYGEFILTLFFLFIYKPGMLRHLNLKHLIVFIALFFVTLGATWQKLNFYFISGVQEAMVTSESMQEYARPALYAGAGMITADYIPFGSGLASFATYASITPYSGAYGQYDLDKIYGLTEESPDFACDAFYPSLAQFGIFGICLFIAFWVYAYSYLRRYVRDGSPYSIGCFIVGSLYICFVLIESIAGTAFTMAAGMSGMMLLAIICSHAPEARKKELPLQQQQKKLI